ncbi:MAG: dihydroneopterin aldolase [Proteobacteria bacterium]|nr:dihydroneopterin aldolase [Pseudomonadota bacterium]
MNLRRVFIRNWKVRALTGIHPYEAVKKQALRLNIALFQEEGGALSGIEDVICYATHKQRMTEIIQAKHYPLLEMMAEALAEAAFEDAKVRQVKIRIEKLKIFPEVESCGVTVERERS